MCIFTVTGREFTGYCRFLKRLYGQSDIPTIFQEQIVDKTLEFKHPYWLDEIMIVTKGSAEKHETEVKEATKKLRSRIQTEPEKMKKCEVFKKSRMDRTQKNKPKRNTTFTRQTGSDNKIRNN